jgi:hypothetical protein
MTERLTITLKACQREKWRATLSSPTSSFLQGGAAVATMQEVVIKKRRDSRGECRQGRSI